MLVACVLDGARKSISRAVLGHKGSSEALHGGSSSDFDVSNDAVWSESTTVSILSVF